MLFYYDLCKFIVCAVLLFFFALLGILKCLNCCFSNCCTIEITLFIVSRSLKLGIVPSPPVPSLGSSQPLVYSMRNSSDTSGFSWNDKRSRQGKETFVLTRSCLAPLIADGSAPG